MDEYEQYVRKRGGKRIIRRVLVANNGIAAVKAIRSIRRWSYEQLGDERLVAFTVMATPEDVAANAEFIRLADTLVSVPGGSNNKNYANVELITDIAERYHCDAVWAGWGHASENPKLPRSLRGKGIAFMGPDADAMHALGDKVASTIIAQSADVPTAGWSGQDIRISYKQHNNVPMEAFKRACVHDEVSAVAVCKKVGFPAMIKASEGGGGKGIRTVKNAAGVPDAYRQVCSEVPGSPVFIMRMIKDARHLEVQIVADEYGEAIALYGRDCSVQRRHQKIIEEGPVVAAPPEIWRELEQAAVRLAKEVGYVGAGTVEYLYTGNRERGQFYFLELNPRLQVEHPVTEWITGVNLPALQLHIAMGVPLGQVRDVMALYEIPPEERGAKLADRKRRPPRGHVLACRVTAENPDEGFQPTSGGIQELTFRNTPNVWGYFSVGSTGGVHEFSDSQFGHLFAWGEDRERARRAMVLTLKDLSIRGDIRTTVEYLVRLLELDDFQQNRIDTTWLDRLIAERIERRKPDPQLAVICGALCWARSFFEAEERKTLEALERGQPPPLRDTLIDTSLELIYDDTKYVMQLSRAAPAVFRVSLNESSVTGTVQALSDGGSIVLFDDRSHVTYIREDVGGMLMVLDGMTCMFPREYDPTTLLSTVNGKLVRFLVSDGDHLAKGTPYAELEVMKMYLSLTAPEAGIVKLAKSAGSVVSIGDVLARLELEDPSKVRRTSLFEGKLPEIKQHPDLGSKAHQRFSAALGQVRLLLAGYRADSGALDDLMSLVDDPEVLFGEVKEALSEGAGRIDAAIVNKVETTLQGLQESGCTSGADVRRVVRGLIECLEARGVGSDGDTPSGKLRSTLQRYDNPGGLKSTVIAELLERYMIALEKRFSLGKRDEDVLFDLREVYRDDLQQVVRMALSHMQLPRKMGIVLTLLKHISASELLQDERMRLCVSSLSEFFSPLYAEVALRARMMLAEFQRPQLREKWEASHAAVVAVIDAQRGEERQQAVKRIADMPELELLACLVLPISRCLDGAEGLSREGRLVAAELYIARAYRAYEVEHLVVDYDDELGFLQGKWMFRFFGEHSGMQQSTLEAVLGAIRPSGMTSYDSADNLRKVEEQLGVDYADDNESTGGPLRFGMLAAFSSLDEMSQGIDRLLSSFEADVEAKATGKPVNVLTILVKLTRDRPDEKDGAANQRSEKSAERSSEADVSRTFVEMWRNAPAARKRAVIRCGIKTITHVVISDDPVSSFPGLYTLRATENFAEDTFYRHIDPPMAFQLELARLVNFNVQRFDYPNRLIHVFFGENNGGMASGGRRKQGSSSSRLAGARAADKDARFFVRAVIQHGAVFSTSGDALVAFPEAEKTFVEALDALELGRCDPRFRHADFNYIFLNVVQKIPVNVDDVEAICRRLFLRYVTRCWNLRVFVVEVRVAGALRSHHGDSPLRFILYNPTGHSLRVEGYKEQPDPLTGVPVLQSLRSAREERGHQHNRPVAEPYPIMDRLQRKQVVAQTLETTYVYDFQHVFSRVLRERWTTFSNSRLRGGLQRERAPTRRLEATELALNEHGQLVPVQRAPGLNDNGIVAWRMKLYTPECPDGREVIVVANDITFMSGSFGPKEDATFAQASRLAREEGIPRVYLAANSGARIGVAEEVRKVFKVRWLDAGSPTKGFSHLYLDERDQEALRGVAHFEESGDITDVIGQADGLGVENLRGSALIARETSLAYEQTFTLTYVTARSVGIGAYLVRLGQRVIQRETNAPIILTGFSALNKVLGRDVYMSNEQLGGVKIMHPNGVTHMVVKDDVEGVNAILDWLSFVPSRRGDPLPTIEPLDPIDRQVAFQPSRGQPYDPRELVGGTSKELGIFDRGSWIETLAGWAKTVVTGRARLGGIPVGIVAVETRTVEKTSPADPASPETHEMVEQQAGQVWYPDSSHKTAQAIRDLDREGLPLFILANWRGFSGGMRDMFDEILKFGSIIVDALREYSQPVTVYVPPCAELRGGAWVVVDTCINPEKIEMYVDPTAHGGVLEPEGTVDVKYRRRELIKTMHRLDPRLQELDAGLSSEADDRDAKGFIIDEKRRQSIREEIAAREAELLPVYKQVACRFADLHDTAGRMKAKGVVRKIVPIAESRCFFYWRLQRRLAQEKVSREISEADPELTAKEVLVLIRRWADQSGMIEGCQFEEDDRAVYQWLFDSEEQIQHRVETVCEEGTARQTARLVKKSKAGVIAGIESAISQLDERDRDEFLGLLQRSLDSVAVSSSSSENHKNTMIATLLNRIGLMPNGETKAGRGSTLLSKAVPDFDSSEQSS
mmetsp:Transcript_4601/g.13903  ORF Transcript_4601/g.13903 Transcript_4601/m.13903 type:complete len:2305 (+) Transcript_4601:192-7106(+)